MNLLYKLLRKFNNDEPSRLEAEHVLKVLCEEPDLNVRAKIILDLYVYAHAPFEYIGMLINVRNRDRIKQIIQKACKRVNGF